MRFDSFILSADDWGLSPGVNEGISDLARAGILKSISVMSTARFAELGWEKLSGLEISLGLHLNFTFESEFQSPGHLLTDKVLSSLSQPALIRLKDKIRDLTRIQLNKFEALSKGRPPSHLDGHQHIHLLVWPWIEDLVLEARVTRVRIPYDPSLWLSAKAPINFWALKLKRQLKRHPQILTPAFAYPPTTIFRDPQKLRAYLESHKHCEILCHPAKVIDFKQYGIEDSLQNERVVQYEGLKTLKAQG